MPFKSKAQQRWMFATKPEMAKEWADHTPDFKKLPERAMPSEGPTSHRGPHNIAHAAHKKGYEKVAELFGLKKEAIFGWSAKEKAEAAYRKSHNVYKSEEVPYQRDELDDIEDEEEKKREAERRKSQPSIHVGGPKLAFDFASAGRMLQTGAGIASMVPGVGQIGGAALGALGGVGQALGNGEGLKGALSRGAIGGAVGAIPGGGLMQAGKQVAGSMVGGAIGDKINAPKPALPVQPQQPGGMPFGPLAR